jgi:hypothetical protein
MRVQHLALAIAFAFFCTSLQASAGPRPRPEPDVPRATPFINKICSPFVPDNWRTTTSVGPAWTAADCQQFGRSIGATHVQMGCIFDRSRSSTEPRFSMGAQVLVRGRLTAAHLPTPNCYWPPIG